MSATNDSANEVTTAGSGTGPLSGELKRKYELANQLRHGFGEETAFNVPRYALMPMKRLETLQRSVNNLNMARRSLVFGAAPPASMATIVCLYEHFNKAALVTGVLTAASFAIPYVLGRRIKKIEDSLRPHRFRSPE